MSDVRVKYIGTADRFSELAITGQQQIWRKSEGGFVSAANASLLVASGHFALAERPEPTLETNASGNPTGSFVTPGGEIVRLASKVGIRTVLLGSSILGQEYLQQAFATKDRSPLVSGDYSTRGRGMVSVLNAMLGMPFFVTYYGGVTGNTTKQILSRADTAFADPFDVLFEDGGGNDIKLFAEEWGTLAAAEDGIVSNRIAVWEKAIAKGCGLINALSITPSGPASAWTTAQRHAALRVNRRLRDEAKRFRCVRFHDLMSVCVDPASADGWARAGFLYDNDRHHSNIGAYHYARKLMQDKTLAAYAQDRAMVSSRLDCIQLDPSSKNLLHTDIGMFYGTPATATGTGVTGGQVVPRVTVGRYAGSGVTVTPSVVDAPSGVGKALRVEMASAVAGDQMRMIILPSVTVTVAEFPKGEWGYFECLVRVSNAVGLTNISATAGITYTGGTPAGPVTSVALSGSLTDVGDSKIDGVLTMVTEPSYFPSDATALSFIKAEVFANFGAAGGATIEVYQASWVKL